MASSVAQRALLGTRKHSRQAEVFAKQPAACRNALFTATAVAVHMQRGIAAK
jgi:hypothetical protein